jgi:hypothetical protein
MPTGPQGQKRPADPARNALKILKIAVGDMEENLETSSTHTRHARAGGHARAKHLTKAQRSAIARKAALVRWNKIHTTEQ